MRQNIAIEGLAAIFWAASRKTTVKMRNMFCCLAIFMVLLSMMPVSGFAVNGNTNSASNTLNYSDETIMPFLTDNTPVTIESEEEPKEVKFKGTLTFHNSIIGWSAYYFKIDEVLEGSIPVDDEIRVMVYCSANPDPLHNYDSLEIGDKAEVYAIHWEKGYDSWVGHEVWGASITSSADYYVKKLGSEPSLSISVWTDKTEYEIGDIITIYYQTNKECTAKLTITKPDGGEVVYGPNEIPVCTRSKLGTAGYPTGTRTVTFEAWVGDEHKTATCYFDVVEEAKEVKFRGKILTDSPIISFYSFNVKIDEVLEDPTGKLQKGETVNVYGHRSGPAQVDDVTVGDEVEVFGEYRGYVGTYEQILLTDSDHYVKEIEKPNIIVTGGLPYYEEPLQVFFKDSEVHVTVQNPDEYTYIVEYWEDDLLDKNNRLVIDEREWIKEETFKAKTTSESEFYLILEELPIGLYRVRIEGTDYWSNNFYVIFNVKNSVHDETIIENYWNNIYTKSWGAGFNFLGYYKKPLFIVSTSHYDEELLLTMASISGEGKDVRPFTEDIAISKFATWVGIFMDAKIPSDPPNDIINYIEIIKSGNNPVGDCDGHSIFLLALARSSGIPARLINGFGDINGKSFEWKHAWTEVYNHGNWQVWDCLYVSEPYFSYEKYIKARDVNCVYDIFDERAVDRCPDYGPCDKSRDIVTGMIKCPADLHAYDYQGRHVGVNAQGGIDLEISDAYYSGPDSEPESIVIFDQTEDITFKVDAVDIGEFNFILTKSKDTKTTTVNYLDVPITETTEATVDVSEANPTYTMEIDKYGDGTEIETKEPDSIESGNESGSESILIGSATTPPNSIVTIQVSVVNVENVSGISFNLLYDPSIVTVSSVSASQNFTGSSITPNIDNVNGITSVLLTNSNLISASAGTPVIDIAFNIVGGSGSSTSLDLQNVEFRDNEFNPYTPAVLVDGMITVGIKGDFNGNDRVDIGDVAKVAFMVAGKVPEGRVDIGDAAKIAFYLAGKVSEL